VITISMVSWYEITMLTLGGGDPSFNDDVLWWTTLYTAHTRSSQPHPTPS